MLISEIEAIDVHAHLGKCRRGQGALLDKFCTASGLEIIGRARKARTVWTAVSSLEALMPRFKANVLAGNEKVSQAVAQIDGLLHWVVLNPLEEQTFKQAERMLKKPKCIGIKIHPEEHGYKIKDHGREIFKFAAENQTIILTHSGDKNSMPKDFVPFANNFPEVLLILGHIGNACNHDLAHQVRAIQSSKHGNIFADTSSARSITPGLLEFAVKEIGPERILYGTDSPLYFAPMQRARIDHAEMSERAKRLILRDNAVAMFELNRYKIAPKPSTI